MAEINQHQQFITEAIQHAVRARTAEIVNEEGDKAAEAVRKRVLAEVDKIALSIAEHYDLRMDRDNVVITVKKA